MKKFTNTNNQNKKSKEILLNELVNIIQKETISKNKEDFTFLGILTLQFLKYVLVKEENIDNKDVWKYLKRPVETYNFNDMKLKKDSNNETSILNFLTECMEVIDNSNSFKIGDRFIKKSVKLYSEGIEKKEVMIENLLSLVYILNVHLPKNCDLHYQYKTSILGLNTIFNEIEINNQVVVKIIKKFDEIHNLDVFDLIDIFIRTKGVNQKLQDHFTPFKICDLLARLTCQNDVDTVDKTNKTISDVCCGIGNLLISSFYRQKSLNEKQDVICIGQDLNEKYIFFAESLMELINEGNNVFYVGSTITGYLKNNTKSKSYTYGENPSNIIQNQINKILKVS